jgi:DNA invertase Pin-like site-specific DNA recombinase
LNKRVFSATIHNVKMINTTREMNMATGVDTNAGIYCRVSHSSTSPGGSSLDSQEVACRRLAPSQGFTVTQVFKEDFPGTELARPLLDQLRSGVKAGAYAAVF